MMKWALVAILLAGVAQAESQPQAVSREAYIRYCTAAAESSWAGLEAMRARWQKSIDLEYVFGYAPPGEDAYLAALYANLYEMTGKSDYLKRAATLLVHYAEYKKAYPPDFFKKRPEYRAGLPAIPNIFVLPKYIHAFGIAKKHNALSDRDRQTVEQNIAESVDLFVDFQEWGPMNRALLRAEAMLYAARVIPDHPHRSRWQMMGKAIADDSRGQWEIEDATGYHAVWLYSLLGYASDALGDESMYRMPVTHYYFRYFLALMCPAGVIPDFGDADWGGGSERMLPFFEKGAAVYKDPELRWAAARLFERVTAPRRPSLYAGLLASDACRWADFSVPAKQPASGSQMVLEDMAGKKAVFRNGWDSSSTYLLYNYRDEGDGGWLFREYLRTTIPVEEEKMHHGHSDENSISLLMSKGSILLHDGGYRDYMPSGPYGAFRADYFHNRVAVRDGKIALGQKPGQHRYASPGKAGVPGQSMLDFFREAGSYRNVRTHHVDFLALTHYDMIRTRLTDDNRGYVGDRSVVYIKDLDLFLVFDCVRFSRETYLTMANLWHTRKIFASGPGWYDTGYDSLRTVDVRGSQRLLIHFPYTERLEEGVEPQRRYYQEERTIYQLIGRHGYPNARQAFVTALIPHAAGQDPAELVKTVRMLDVSAFPGAAGVSVSRGGKTYIVGVKFDLEKELTDDWRRPMYSYESGATKFGDYETDAYHLFVVEDQTSLTYTMAGGVQISYKGRLLHKQQPSTSSLRFDGGPDLEGTGKVRYWEETVRKEP